jgi:hypothetical protein
MNITLKEIQNRLDSIHRNKANNTLTKIRDEASTAIKIGDSERAEGAVEELYAIALCYESYFFDGTVKIPTESTP